ncbi:hypothetical protein NDU88_000429 [Pleurodeles waltl]|uniref:Uncharacterized protein n=1 Tax=Pleurodeles waltl TaxID=8319 RepID=A0AAV7U3Y2_PLEWA|nr:hypothetical protein NDU88_000429 [Pleurodeles waltl]
MEMHSRWGERGALPGGCGCRRDLRPGRVQVASDGALGRAKVQRGSGREQKVQGDPGRAQKVQGDPGRAQKVQGDPGRAQKVQGDSGRAQRGSGRVQKVQRGTGRIQKVQGDSGRIEKVQGDSGRIEKVQGGSGQTHHLARAAEVFDPTARTRRTKGARCPLPGPLYPPRVLLVTAGMETALLVVPGNR